MKTAKLSELAALRNDSGLKGNYEAQFALATALKQKVGSSTTADLNRLYSIRAAYQQDKANMTGRLSNLGNSSAKKDSLKKLEGLYKFGVNFLDTKIGKLNGQSAGTNVVPLNGSPVLGNNRIPTTSTIPAPASNFGPSPTPVPSSIPGSAIPNWRGNLPPGQFNGGAPNGQFNGGAPNGQFNGGAPNGGFNGGAPNGGFNPVPQRNGVPQSNGGQFNSGGTAPPNNFVPNQNLRPQNGVPAGGQNPFGAQAPTNNTVPTSPGGFQNGGIFGGRIRDRVFGNGQN